MKTRTLMLRTILFVIAAVAFVACGDGGTEPEPDPDPCGRCVPADFAPAWSPNGSEIAVSSSYPDGGNNFDIQLIDTLGNAVRLTSGVIAGHPTWSPDGSRIAFSGWPGVGETRLYVVNRDGSGLTELLSLLNLSDPAWSPDGETIAFDTENGLYLFDMATSVVTGLGVGGLALSWSPDGSQAVFVSTEGGGLSRMEADGSGVMALFAGNVRRGPAWSPCTEIAFSVFESQTEYPPSFIHLMDSDGSNVRKLPIQGTAPTWSPDCSKIAFANEFGIQIINADGSGLRTLTRR